MGGRTPGSATALQGMPGVSGSPRCGRSTGDGRVYRVMGAPPRCGAAAGSSADRGTAHASASDIAVDLEGQGIARAGSSWAIVRSSVGSCSRSMRYAVSAGSVSAWKPWAQPAGMYTDRWVSPSRSKESHRPNSGDQRRRSTTTSKTAPEAHRTSFASPRPVLTWRPRTTPRRDREMLPDTNVPGWTPAPRVMDASNVRLVNLVVPVRRWIEPHDARDHRVRDVHRVVLPLRPCSAGNASI